MKRLIAGGLILLALTSCGGETGSVRAKGNPKSTPAPTPCPTFLYTPIPLPGFPTSTPLPVCPPPTPTPLS